MHDPLKNLLKYITPFEESELTEIVQYFKPRTLKKNTLIHSAGNICKEFYFIKKGCIRTYFIDKKGQEKTRYVMLDNHIGTSFASFINQAPSIEFVDGLEDTELFVISHTDFYRLNSEMPHWKDFYQKILEMAYTFQTQSFENLTTLTAKERYDKVLKEKPILVQRLSNKVLSSYLDISQETLSRLKSK